MMILPCRYPEPDDFASEPEFHPMTLHERTAPAGSSDPFSRSGWRPTQISALERRYACRLRFTYSRRGADTNGYAFPALPSKTRKALVRIIDREEFKAESKAALARALAHSQQRREEEQARIAKFMGRTSNHVGGYFGRHPAKPKAAANKAVKNKALATPRKPRTGTPPPHTRYYTAFGQTQTITKWSQCTGLATPTIRERLNRGWDVERAVTEPARSLRSSKAC